MESDYFQGLRSWIFWQDLSQAAVCNGVNCTVILVFQVIKTVQTHYLYISCTDKSAHFTQS